MYENNRGGLQRYNARGSAQIASMVTAFRDDFNGEALDLNNWEPPTVGAGHTVLVSFGELSIFTGVTPNSETILRSLNGLAVPCRVWFIARLSARIANQEFYFEIVDASGNTVLRHLLDGTSTSAGKIEAVSAGNSLGPSTSTAYQSSAADSIYEIRLTEDEATFVSRAVDTTINQNVIGIKTRNIPNPNGTYYIRVRAKNLATAPIYGTVLTLGAVLSQEINEVSVDVTGGQGNSTSSQSVGVIVNGVATAQSAVTFYNDSEAALGASATFTGTSRDLGASIQYGKKSFGATVFSDQSGTLYIDMSNNGTIWRQAAKTPVAANDSATLWVFSVTRYYRVRYVNGAAAQTAFMLNSSIQGA